MKCVCFVLLTKKSFLQQSALKGNKFLPLVKCCFSNKFCRSQKNNCTLHSGDDSPMHMGSQLYGPYCSKFQRRASIPHASFSASIISLWMSEQPHAHTRANSCNSCKPVCQLIECEERKWNHATITLLVFWQTTSTNCVCEVGKAGRSESLKNCPNVNAKCTYCRACEQSGSEH